MINFRKIQSKYFYLNVNVFTFLFIYYKHKSTRESIKRKNAFVESSTIFMEGPRNIDLIHPK